MTQWQNRIWLIKTNLPPLFKSKIKTFYTTDSRAYCIDQGRTLLWCLKKKLQMLCKGESRIGGDTVTAKKFFSDNGRYKTYPVMQSLERMI